MDEWRNIKINKNTVLTKRGVESEGAQLLLELLGALYGLSGGSIKQSWNTGTSKSK